MWTMQQATQQGSSRSKTTFQASSRSPLCYALTFSNPCHACPHRKSCCAGAEYSLSQGTRALWGTRPPSSCQKSSSRTLMSKLFCPRETVLRCSPFSPSTLDLQVYLCHREGKVVCCLQVWANSALETTTSKFLIRSIGIIRFCSPFGFRIHKFLWATVWGHPRAYNRRPRDRDYLISFYNRWTEEVKSIVPEEQLLVFNVKQGWEPLCRCAASMVCDI
jgi:hypothetical protein